MSTFALKTPFAVASTAFAAMLLLTGCPGGDDDGGADEAGDGSGDGSAGDDGDGDGDGDGGDGTGGDDGGDGADDGGEPAGPHAMGTILLGEAHPATGGNSTPIVSAGFVPDVAGASGACTQQVAGCEIALVPDCGDTGCDDGEYCGFNDGCQSTCLDICDAACGSGEVCYFPSPGNAACKSVETFDAGALTFGGTTTALTLFPPYSFSGESSGAPFAPNAGLTVDASGAAAAGYEPFSREFTATELLQTDLETISLVEAYGDGPIPITWIGGAEEIVVTAAVTGLQGTSSVVTCETDDSGSFAFPREAIDAAIDDEALGGITLTVARKRTETHKDLTTKGTLVGAMVQPEGWLELVTMSSESHTIEGCDFGEAVCGDACVDVLSDPDNCGTCGNACDGGCFDGECATATGTFDDCLNGDMTCGGTNMCLTDNPASPSIGICTQACNVVGDCPAAPGGTPACIDVTGDGATECVLDCSSGQACPTGTTCFAGVICAYF
jgi:hypothetical protein